MSETRHHSPDPDAVKGIDAVEMRMYRLDKALDRLFNYARVATAQAPVPDPGPYTATARVTHIAKYLDYLIQRVASSSITFVPAKSDSFRFFYAEKQGEATSKYNEWPDPDDITYEKIDFCAARFYFEGTDNYIIKISVVGKAAAELQVRMDVAGISDETVKTRIGFMHISTYKKLFRVVVAKDCADLLGDPIGDHIHASVSRAP
jgi:hypothetical protein